MEAAVECEIENCLTRLNQKHIKILRKNINYLRIC